MGGAAGFSRKVEIRIWAPSHGVLCVYVCGCVCVYLRAWVKGERGETRESG